MRAVTPRLRRFSVGLATAALVGTGLLATPAAQAAEKVVPSDQVDLTETRATGHNDFIAAGVRVWTEGATSTDKAAGYFDVDAPLADVGEPSMLWFARNGNGGSNLRPSVQLKVDLDADGSIDGILVGEPTYADGSPLYGDVWWLSNGSKQFAKDAAPSHTGGYGSTNHGTLDGWRAAFPSAQVIQGGWSLGSGVRGDGVIGSITIGDDFYFEKSAEPETKVLYATDVDMSNTRDKGHNVFRPTSGVRITTDASACDDPKPGGGTWCANKAAGYFDVGVPLKAAGEPSMVHDRLSGGVPGLQLVVDLDGDGQRDGILVGESIYGMDWWLSEAAPSVQAPQTGGGFGSDRHGLLSEWRAMYPHAKVLQSGWSLGSGVQGDGILSSITVGSTRYTFTGKNRAPVAKRATAQGPVGTTVEIPVPVSDPDGDTLTVTSTASDTTVSGTTLLVKINPAAVRTRRVHYTVDDGRGGTATNYVTVEGVKASSTTTIRRLKPSTKFKAGREVTVYASVASTGKLSGSEVEAYVDGVKVATKSLASTGNAVLDLGVMDEVGTHTLVLTFPGSAYVTASSSEPMQFEVK